MPSIFSPHNVEEVAANILSSNITDVSDFRELAQQVVFKALRSPDEAAMCSRQSVALMEAICEPATDNMGEAEPLGGSTGPGKAFRLALLQECLEVFEEALSDMEYVFFLPTRHPEYLQAKSNLSAFSNVLCSFVNWRLLRDTSLNHCLKALLTFTYSHDLSEACVELAANIIEAVDPWMEENWGYTSRRYLDAYFYRIEHWCHRQIWLSRTPQGRFVDVPFCHDVLDKLVTPRMQWIHEQQEKMAGTLELPAVDVAAAEALGRSRAPFMQTLLKPAPSMHIQPVEQLNKTELDYPSAMDSASLFAYSPLPVSHASAEVLAPMPPYTNDTLREPQDAAQYNIAASEGAISLDRAVLPLAASIQDTVAAPVFIPCDDDTAIPAAAVAIAPSSAPAAVASSTAATAEADCAPVGSSVPDQPQATDIPANVSTSSGSNSASSRSALSLYAPSASSSSSSSNTGDTTNSPDSHSSSNTAEGAESPQPAQSSHGHGVKDTSPPRLLAAAHKPRSRSVGRSAHTSQPLPNSDAHTHAQTRVLQARSNTHAQLDTMSSNHPEDAPISDSHCTPAEEHASLNDAVDRALQEFMLSHDSADFIQSIQALVGGHNVAGVLQTLLQSATAKLEKLSRAKAPLSVPGPFPRARKALQKHMEEQLDRLFCRGGVINPDAFDFNQDGAAHGRRSGLGFQIPGSNPGYRLMTRWGWEEGRGLGANLQGRTEPCLPDFQPLDPDNCKQGLGEMRYKGILKGEAAANQLRGLLVEMCSGENAVLAGAVQEGFHAFLTSTPSSATPHASLGRALCWVGSLMGALIHKGSLTEEQASSLVGSGVTAAFRPGSVGSSPAHRLSRSMWAAVSKQRATCRRQEEQAQEAKRKEAKQLAELHQPKAPSKKTTYVQGPEGKSLRIRIKQYGGSAAAAPSSDGRVSWE